MNDKQILVDRVIPFAILVYASYFSTNKIEEHAGTPLAAWWLLAAAATVVMAFIVLLAPRGT